MSDVDLITNTLDKVKDLYPTGIPLDALKESFAYFGDRNADIAFLVDYECSENPFVGPGELLQAIITKGLSYKIEDVLVLDLENIDLLRSTQPKYIIGFGQPVYARMFSTGNYTKDLGKILSFASSKFLVANDLQEISTDQNIKKSFWEALKKNVITA